jgi:AraC-like DNA-binding protein
MRGFKEAENFDVRYYTRWELRRIFEETIGAARMSTDSQFGLGWQMSENKLMAGKHNATLLASEPQGRISDVVPPMRSIVDSLCSEATKPV